MIFSSPRFSRRMLLALGVVLCILPGCGSGSGGNSVITSTVARSLTQTFQGQPAVLAVYSLDGPIDPTKPLVITVGGTPLVQGKDYFIDQTLPNVVHVNNPVSAATTVVVQCTTLPTTTQRFNVTSINQANFTLSRPADPTYPNVFRVAVGSRETGSQTTLASQQYTVTFGPPTVIRVTQPVSTFSTLSLTYVPQPQ